ncbi:MAG: RAMP superfamily CRISPR-associated protein, partial [Ardenticatenaceae bacterium]
MNELWLCFTLLSEASFSRGDGLPGVVDVEVNYDRYGFPFLGGRTLKGLLHAEATEIVDALHQAEARDAKNWAMIRDRLFGRPGSRQDRQGILHVGDA